MKSRKLQLYPKYVFWAFLIMIAFLLVMNVWGIYIMSTTETPDPFQYHVIRLFHFNKEGNITAFFSSIALLLASVLLFVVSFNEKQSKKPYLGWIGLGCVFAFLAVDEAVSLHEALVGPFREYFNLTGYLYYAWVLPYGVAVLLLIIIYIPFFLRLNVRMFFLMMLSGFIFITGAIGFEMVSGKEAENSGYNLKYMILYTFEELFEMIGVSIFIYSLIWFMSISNRKVSLVFGSKTKIEKDISKSRTLKDVFSS